MRNLVIIPTYNELDNIRPMIDKVFSLPEKFDLLVIDDGSPDGTAEIVREPAESVSRIAAPDRASGQAGARNRLPNRIPLGAGARATTMSSRWTATSRTTRTT